MKAYLSITYSLTEEGNVERRASYSFPVYSLEELIIELEAALDALKTRFPQAKIHNSIINIDYEPN